MFQTFLSSSKRKIGSSHTQLVEDMLIGGSNEKLMPFTKVQSLCTRLL